MTRRTTPRPRRGRAEPEANLRPDLAELDRFANTMDARFSLFGIRFGYDSIIGLIPGIGDFAASGAAGYLIWKGHRMGASRRTLVRMGINSGIDAVLGSIPLLGDLFDVAFKANRRNVELLKRDLSRKPLASERASSRVATTA